MSNKSTTLEHLRAASIRSKTLASEVAQAAADAIEEVAMAKADKAAWQTVTLPESSWIANEDADSLAAGYDYCCEAALTGVAATDSAESVLTFASLAEARAASLSPTTDVLDGKIRYYAVTKPTAAIIMQVRPIYGGSAS